MEPATYRLSELAEAAGVTPRTVRYYIAQGLLSSPGRLGAGTRYDRTHLDRLHLIRTLQDQGLSLSEIRDRLEHRPSPMLARASWAPQDPRLDMRRPMPMPPAPPPGRSVWERLSLSPDLELHVRRPHSEATRQLIDEIKSFVSSRLD